MKTLKGTKTYNEIVSMGDPTGSPIAYYIDSGEAVTEANLESIIDREMLRYQRKLEDIRAQQSDFFFTDDMLRLSVRNQVERFLNKNFLRVQTIYVNPMNIDEVLEMVESIPEFHSWCVE